MAKVKKNWLGKEEDTEIEYNISYEVVDFEVDDDILIQEKLSIENFYKSAKSSSLDKRADKFDCSIAASIGLLTGAIDIFWVGEFSILEAQTWGRKHVNQFVIKISQLQGYPKDDLEGAIKYLEKKFPNPSDKLTPNFGGGLQHHLRDFSHHPTLLGLICSILTQFTGEGFGTDTEGNFISVSIPESDLIGNNFEEKIFLGVVNWIFHLISDMSGSSQNAGAGTGIPGLILSFLKEASTLPLIKEIRIKYKNENIPISKWISKLFNGTAFPHKDLSDIVRLDLRTEIGIYRHLTKQSVPTIVNQCLVRAFYLVTRLVLEVKSKDIKSVSDLNRLDPKIFIPRNNRCITRMLTISSGVFSTIDVSEALITSAVKNRSSKGSFTLGVLFRINFVGIGSFAFAIKNDARYIASDIKDSFQLKVPRVLAMQKLIPKSNLIQMEVIMDNRELYQYTFDTLLKRVKESIDAKIRTRQYMDTMFSPIIRMGDRNHTLNNDIVSANEAFVITAIADLVIAMFDQNSIPYVLFPMDPQLSGMTLREQRKKLPFHFVMIEEGKRVGYYFDNNTRKIYDELESYDLDCVKIVKMYHMEDSVFSSYYQKANEYNSEADIDVRFCLFRDVFRKYFGPDEYDIFLEYVNDFNERALNLIGFSTVITPSEEAIAKFRIKVGEMIFKYPYKDYIPKDIFENQVRILTKNYLERGLYKAMVGYAPFAVSFVSSEWYYGMYKVTNSLDQTGIVAGYLKSVEQLLYAIIQFSKDKGKIFLDRDKTYIEYTNDNESRIDKTLGSLITFFKLNNEILDVSDYVKNHIINIIDDWRDKNRNGYFHKDNLQNVDKIEEIRKKAIYLYFLILGGCTISNEQFEILLMQPNTDYELNSEVNEFQYNDFDKWLTLLLRHPLINKANAINFCLYLSGEKHWTLQLNSSRNYNENNYVWTYDVDFSSGRDNYDWQFQGTWEEALNQVTDGLGKYLEISSTSTNLKRFNAVVVSHRLDVKVVYKK